MLATGLADLCTGLDLFEDPDQLFSVNFDFFMQSSLEWNSTSKWIELTRTLHALQRHPPRGQPARGPLHNRFWLGGRTLRLWKS
ncbi:hypothetical protein C2859_07315 [Xanthomonas citri pv. glycines]|nr:hypothetical protein BHE84_23525 [Xanthomonas citri pv. glycines str. 8ra]QEQ72858.1 hypothetical protein C2859_07315 [Xanthomonas citri pv. glycines]